MEWFTRLPRAVRPLALVNKYPRIANTLALDWNRSPACRGYFVDLLANGRGHRRGFPANVDRDLRRLCDYYHTLHPTRERRQVATNVALKEYRPVGRLSQR